MTPLRLRSGRGRCDGSGSAGAAGERPRAHAIVSLLSCSCIAGEDRARFVTSASVIVIAGSRRRVVSRVQLMAQAVLQRALHDLWCGQRQVDRDHEAAGPYAFDESELLLECRGFVHDVRGDLLRAFEKIILLDGVEDGHGGGYDERIGSVGGRVRTGRERPGHLGPSDHGADGAPPPSALASVMMSGSMS